MAAKVTFGVRLPTGGPLSSLKAVRESALEAEQLGYSTIWARDNLSWSNEMARSHISEGAAEAFTADSLPILYEPIVALGLVASLTQKIKLGFSVLCLPFRHPVVLGKQIATLDAMSDGRVILGIGAGAWKEQFDSFQIPYDRRGLMMDEGFHALKQIWTTDKSSFEGDFFQFKDMVVYPKPSQKPYPPVMVGGRRRAAFRRVAEYGDGWLTPSDSSLEEVKAGISFIQKYAEKFNRRGKEFVVCSETHACIAENDSEALRKVSRTLTNQITPSASSLADLKTIQERTMVGSSGTLIEQAQRFAREGVSHFELKFVYSTLEDLLNQMRLFSKEVIPSF
jgi:probable F420-dependent oxidoreductase